MGKIGSGDVTPECCRLYVHHSITSINSMHLLCCLSRSGETPCACDLRGMLWMLLLQVTWLYIHKRFIEWSWGFIEYSFFFFPRGWVCFKLYITRHGWVLFLLGNLGWNEQTPISVEALASHVHPNFNTGRMTAPASRKITLPFTATR